MAEEEAAPKPRAPRSNPFGSARPREEVLAAQPTAASTAPHIAGCVHATANLQALAWQTIDVGLPVEFSAALSQG